MKWTATMFGLALMTSSPFVKVQARLLRSIKIPPGPFRPRGKVLKLPWPCPGYYGVMVRRPGALASPGPPLLHIGRGVGQVLTSGSLRPREHPRPRLGTRGRVPPAWVAPPMRWWQAQWLASPGSGTCGTAQPLASRVYNALVPAGLP
jgi:hypothetical protein